MCTWCARVASDGECDVSEQVSEQGRGQFSGEVIRSQRMYSGGCVANMNVHCYSCHVWRLHASVAFSLLRLK